MSEIVRTFVRYEYGIEKVAIIGAKSGKISYSNMRSKKNITVTKR